MSPTGRDLVRGLMNLNPLKRLGMAQRAGSGEVAAEGNELEMGEGSVMDYDSLKDHPFFEAIDFEEMKTR